MAYLIALLIILVITMMISKMIRYAVLLHGLCQLYLACQEFFAEETLILPLDEAKRYLRMHRETNRASEDWC